MFVGKNSMLLKQMNIRMLQDLFMPYYECLAKKQSCYHTSQRRRHFNNLEVAKRQSASIKKISGYMHSNAFKGKLGFSA